MIANYRLRYRPLRAGVAISSAELGTFGTLGCLATSDGQDRWGVTAGHVITRTNALRMDVFQPDLRAIGALVSEPATALRFAAGMDVVAFRIARTVTTSPVVLELGRWQGVAEPVSGMQVLKSGFATGVTRARIGQVDANGFEVLPEPGMPAGYSAFAGGDSGAAWMTDDARLVGIHVSQNPQSGVGRAMRLKLALSRMGLQALS
ncbi:MAG TPA: hypothetical protein VIT90_09905 [Lysobacter sp.]